MLYWPLLGKLNVFLLLLIYTHRSDKYAVDIWRDVRYVTDSCVGRNQSLVYCLECSDAIHYTTMITKHKITEEVKNSPNTKQTPRKKGQVGTLLRLAIRYDVWLTAKSLYSVDRTGLLHSVWQNIWMILIRKLQKKRRLYVKHPFISGYKTVGSGGGEFLCD